MKKGLIFLLAAISFVSCVSTVQRLHERAEELCRHVPNPEALEQSKGYMTDEFYAVLDSMIHLPDETPVLHEWEFWFVTSDGSPIVRGVCEVVSVERTDENHAQVMLLVQPEDEDYEAEEHTMQMERVAGQWLLSDFDGHKANARRYIGNAKSCASEKTL